MAWRYKDDMGTAVGPVPADHLRTLLHEGDIDGLTHVCAADGGEDWRPLGEVPELKSALLAAGDDDDHDADADELPEATTASLSASSSAQPGGSVVPGEALFYNADPSGAQAGPAPVSYFAALAAAGLASPSTLVWGPPMTGWQPLSTVPELLAAVAGATTASSAASSSLVAAGPGRPAGADGASSDTEGGDGAGEGVDASMSAASGPTADGAAGGSSSSSGSAVSGNKRKRDRRGGGGGGWKAAKVNPWVYVTGIPPDATEDELARHFRKAGLVKLDPATQKPRVKLYRDEGGSLKGDGSVCYVQEASVELALQLLDGVDLRPGFPLCVEPALFERKDGHAAASGAPKKKLRRGAPLTREQQAARIKALEQRVALSWAEEGDESTGLHVVVLKHMFTPQEMEAPGCADELAAEVAEEAGRLGEIVNLSVFSRHHDGPVMIRFKSAGAAAEAISTFNGRWFGGRQLVCEFWDGLTDFKGDTEGRDEAAEKQRIDDFGKWLEGEEGRGEG